MGTRKRVHAIRRGPDGSAFRRCEECSVLVPIALVDMHECEIMKRKNNVIVKRLKKSDFGQEQKFQDQPRSAYCFFVEEFKKTCEEETEVDANRSAFEIWKNMTPAEKNPYLIKAKEVNAAYEKALLEEENDMTWVDDEADSTQVWNCYKNHKDYDPFDSPNWSNEWWSETSGSSNALKDMRSKMFVDCP